MSRALTQRGSGYPGTWELSNVTRWVNPEACYFERREAIHSAATPPLGAAERTSRGGRQELRPRSPPRGSVGLGSMRAQAVVKGSSISLNLWHSEHSFGGFDGGEGGFEEP
jgi:hypothetical protein